MLGSQDFTNLILSANLGRFEKRLWTTGLVDCVIQNKYTPYQKIFLIHKQLCVTCMTLYYYWMDMCVKLW